MNIVVDKDLQELSYIFGKNANFNLLSLAPENIRKENKKSTLEKLKSLLN